jgi:hypothetical protein
MSSSLDSINLEGDIYQLAQKVFSVKPGPPNSICPSFDGLSLKETYEELMIFLVEGLKIKYGQAQTKSAEQVQTKSAEQAQQQQGKIELQNLTPTELLEMNAYMQSLGLVLKLDVYSVADWYFDKGLDYIPYDKLEITQKTPLSALHYAFLIQNNYYVVAFDFLK